MTERVSTQKVLDEVAQERTYQDRRWGGPSHDDSLGPRDWFTFMDKYWYFERTCPLTSKEYRSNLVKLAALAVAAIESFDRKEARINRPAEFPLSSL